MISAAERYELVVIPYSTADVGILNDEANHVWSEFLASKDCSELLNPLLGSQFNISNLPNPFVIEPYECGIGASEIAYVVLGVLRVIVVDAGKDLAKEKLKQALTYIFNAYIYPKIRRNLPDDDLGDAQEVSTDQNKK